MFSTLTSKGQLTLPKKVRELLGLKNGDKVGFSISETGKVEIAPVRTNLKELKGLLKPVSGVVSLEEMREAIENIRAE